MHITSVLIPTQPVPLYMYVCCVILPVRTFLITLFWISSTSTQEELCKIVLLPTTRLCENC